MDFNCLKFASMDEACDFLYEIMDGKVVIGSSNPEEGDLITLYHPKDKKWYVMKYPGNNIEYYNKKDLVAEFPESLKLEKIAQNLRVQIFAPLYEARKSISIDTIPDFIIADSIPSDQDLGYGDLEFAVTSGSSASGAKVPGRFKDRKYHPYPGKFSKQQNLDSFKKAPVRMMKKEDRAKRTINLNKMPELTNQFTASQFVNPSVVFNDGKKFTERELTRAVRQAIAAEQEAIHLYEFIVDATDNDLVKKTLQDIANEEKVHVGELQAVLKQLLPDEQKFLDEGSDEIGKEDIKDIVDGRPIFSSVEEAVQFLSDITDAKIIIKG